MSNSCSYNQIRHEESGHQLSHLHHSPLNHNDYNPIGNETQNYTANPVIYSNLTSNSTHKQHNIQIYQFNDEDHTQSEHENQEQQVIVVMDEHEVINSVSNQSSLIQLENNQVYEQQNRLNKKLNTTPNNTIVPTMSNVDDIFQLLSQKIAKYCQVLADLTNCEVFYKAQLPLNSNQTSSSNDKTVKTSKYKPKSTTKQIRSLYWGTHQMLFQYSHNQGLKYDKSMGDSLIKINQRSLSSDVNNLIEEILNEPNFNLKLNKISTNSELDESRLNFNESAVLDQQTSKKKTESNHLDDGDKKSEIKDCFVYLNRIDDSIFDQYLNKFEQTNNQINNSSNKHEFEEDLNLPSEEELYSDEFRINFSKLINKNGRLNKTNLMSDDLNALGNNDEDENDEEDDEDDLDEKTLLVKNCFGINENEEDYYSCEYCLNHSFKHLTQLKLHQLRVHENIPIQNENSNDYECLKCKLNVFESRVDYLKHILLCFYPDIYSCKTCNQSFLNYSQYLFHSKYVHTHVVYMCAVCGRKYRQIKDLLDHDQLMHSKSLNYCEICFEQLNSRKCLYEHYKNAHINEFNGLVNINESVNPVRRQSREKSSDSLDSIQPILETNQSETFRAPNVNSTVVINDQNSKTIQSEQIEMTEPSSSTIEFVLTETEEICKQSNENKTLPINENSQVFETPTEWSKVHKNDLIRGLIDRKHQCKWCSLRFFTKSQLKQHETTHVNSVLFCPVCDKEFTHKDRLSGHMKCHMEPSLECKVCGKKFKRLCNLYNHELVHGLTEHAFMLCQFCGRGFRSRRDYQNHVIANHRDQLMKSDTMNQISSNQLMNLTENKKQSKKQSKGQTRKTSLNGNTSATTTTYQLQNEPDEQYTKTTTIVLTDDPINLDTNNNNTKHTLVDLNEPDTYFTRTGTVHLSHDLDDDEDFENEDEIDDENQDYINEFVNNMDSQNFNLTNSHRDNSNNNNHNTNNITSNNNNDEILSSRTRRKQIRTKSKNLLKNKIKRLKSALNIEVLDDDDDGNDQEYINTTQSNINTHVVNYGTNSNQITFSHDISNDFNGIMHHSNVHLVHLNDNLV